MVVSLDKTGNLRAGQFVETGHRPLTMDYTIWEEGQTGTVGDFVQQSSRNRIVTGQDPWGKDVPIWEAYSVDGSTAYGGIYYKSHSIDNTKLYRMSWWEKRVSNGTATYARHYIGLNAYGSVPGVRDCSNGTVSTNPYFWNTSNLPTSTQMPIGEWVLCIGHVYPHDYTNPPQRHPDSGIYTLDGRLNEISTDWQWLPETTSARSRTLSLYNANGGGAIHHTVYPREDICDGTEPTVAELLAGFDSNNLDYIRARGGRTPLNLDIRPETVITGRISEFEMDVPAMRLTRDAVYLSGEIIEV